MATKKKVAKKKVANKITKKKAKKKAHPKRKSVVKRGKESIKTSTSVNSTHKSPPKDSKRTVVGIKTNVEQPKEDVMAGTYGAGSPHHQTPNQETEFQDVLRDLSDQSAAGDSYRAAVIANPKFLAGLDLSPEQQLTLIAVGHASGKYTFEPGHGFCCCCA